MSAKPPWATVPELRYPNASGRLIRQNGAIGSADAI